MMRNREKKTSMGKKCLKNENDKNEEDFWKHKENKQK